MILEWREATSEEKRKAALREQERLQRRLYSLRRADTVHCSNCSVLIPGVFADWDEGTYIYCKNCKENF